MPIVATEQLRRLTTAIFERAGAPAETAACVTDHLVEANLAGHDSHGVMRILQYVDLIRDGKLRPTGQMQVVEESPAGAVVDGGAGFGQLIARDAMRLAVKKGRAGGAGAVGVRNCSHTGRIGTYTQMAAREGLIGIAMVNSGGAGQLVAPFGGIARRLATNPISIAAPSGGEFPIMLDIASSVAPEGKMRTRFLAKQSAPPGWLIDSAGNPSTNPADFYGEPCGALQPLGGAVGHKGFAMAFVIDILAGVLTGAGCSSPGAEYTGDGMLAMALDVRQFTPLAGFERRVADLAAYVKSCPRAPGCQEIFVPGEPEQREREKRIRDGIPIDTGVWTQITEVCARLKVELPHEAT